MAFLSYRKLNARQCTLFSQLLTQRFSFAGGRRLPSCSSAPQERSHAPGHELLCASTVPTLKIHRPQHPLRPGALEIPARGDSYRSAGRSQVEQPSLQAAAPSQSSFFWQPTSARPPHPQPPPPPPSPPPPWRRLCLARAPCSSARGSRYGVLTWVKPGFGIPAPPPPPCTSLLPQRCRGCSAGRGQGERARGGAGSRGCGLVAPWLRAALMQRGSARFPARAQRALVIVEPAPGGKESTVLRARACLCLCVRLWVGLFFFFFPALLPSFFPPVGVLKTQTLPRSAPPPLLSARGKGRRRAHGSHQPAAFVPAATTSDACTRRVPRFLPQPPLPPRPSQPG
ncbi:uncharacterized protein [Struthio camelus]|uniref:uncharacterized protein n=1 Tax=Struthio camelus TaxID=8801 RepID=UPI0036042AC0